MTMLGILPSLAILRCDFQSNTGADAGGAGALADSLDNLVFTITDSTASVDNSAPVCPDIIGFYDNSVEPVCILASENFP